jgi:hypothetical protein
MKSFVTAFADRKMLLAIGRSPDHKLLKKLTGVCFENDLKTEMITDGIWNPVSDNRPPILICNAMVQ